MLLRRMLGLALLFSGYCAIAQTVSPVIAEYKTKAAGRITLVNNTLAPMAVVLEPKSFSITPDGKGVFRPLDADIHLMLSSMSFRIDPGQTYYVFYSARADKLPTWFTVYAVFSRAQHGQGIDVRFLLPHTVYIYPKKPLSKTSGVQFKDAVYLSQSKEVVFDLVNSGPDLTRVQEVRVTSGKETATAAGFPLLPGGERHVEVNWTEAKPPETILLQFEHSTMKQPIGTGGQ